MTSNLPPGVTDATIEEQFGERPNVWEDYQKSEGESLTEREQELIEEIWDRDDLFLMIDKFLGWYGKRVWQSALSDDEMAWDMDIGQRLGAAGIDADRVRNIVHPEWNAFRCVICYDCKLCTKDCCSDCDKVEGGFCNCETDCCKE